MKRITVEMVKEAYAKTGFEPRQGCFYEIDDENEDDPIVCACAIGALHTSVSDEYGEDYAAESWSWREFGERYSAGFQRGFDGVEMLNEFEKQGYEDGRAAWEAVKEK